MTPQSVSRCAGHPSAPGGSSRRGTRPVLGRTRRSHAAAEIVARQIVAFVLRVFADGGEKVHVAANALARLEVRLKRSRRHLTSVDVDG